MTDAPRKKPSTLVTITLWIISIVIAVGLMAYQRKTGPTYPITGEQTIGTARVTFELLRSENTGTPLPITVEVSDASLTGEVRYKRYKKGDDVSPAGTRPMPMTLRTDEKTGATSLHAELPPLPMAGKYVYFVFVSNDDGRTSLTDVQPVIARYKGAVPTSILAPHVILMMLAMLWAVRTALETFRPRGRPRVHLVISTLLVLVGGMILGPIVQKYAFDAYWTGVPFGWDLTDNKTLVAMLGWLLACVMNITKLRRTWILSGALIMLLVFIIPHSMLGSESDYTKEPGYQNPSAPTTPTTETPAASPAEPPADPGMDMPAIEG
jgi:hypothetical protein